MKKLLIINTYQLGFLTDTLKYCEHLRRDYLIDFVCFNYGYDKIQIENVRVTYIPRPNNRAFQGILFFGVALFRCLFYRGRIFVVYFPYCSYLKRILFWKKMNIDIRTLSVDQNEEVRISADLMLKKEIGYFDSASFISQGVKNKIAADFNKISYILPLGADPIVTKDKKFDQFKLLYVGTLYNRNIIDTVKGLKLFIKKYPDISITYDIIGSGFENEIEELNGYIIENNLSGICQVHGRIPYSELKPFFDKCNIGVSYIPITDYYQYQPPTKTYEYALSGMAVIATKTISNESVINEKNGVLIKDNPEAFMNAIEKLLIKKGELNSRLIIESMDDYRWGKIIEKYLIPIIEV